MARNETAAQPHLRRNRFGVRFNAFLCLWANQVIRLYAFWAIPVIRFYACGHIFSSLFSVLGHARGPKRADADERTAEDLRYSLCLLFRQLVCK